MSDYISTIKDLNNNSYPIYDSRLKQGYCEDSINAGTNYTEDGVIYTTSAGMLAFCWNQVDNDELVYTFYLSDSAGAAAQLSQSIPVNSYVSIKAYYSWSFAGTLKYAANAGDNTITVQLSKQPPSNWNPSDYLRNEDQGYLWFPEYPVAGIIHKGIGATTFGRGNKSNEEGSLAIGRRNVADGRYSLVLGRENYGGYNSLVSGYQNKCFGVQNTCTGYLNEVYGTNNAVCGKRNIVNGSDNLICGQSNTANQNQCISSGYLNILDATNSAAFGVQLQTGRSSQVVVGRYNVKDTSNSLFIVGNGSANDTRSNALEVRESGDLIVQGSITASQVPVVTQKKFEQSDLGSFTFDSATYSWSSSNEFTDAVIVIKIPANVSTGSTPTISVLDSSSNERARLVWSQVTTDSNAKYATAKVININGAYLISRSGFGNQGSWQSDSVCPQDTTTNSHRANLQIYDGTFKSISFTNFSSGVEVTIYGRKA